LKDFIESVIADMVNTGELEAGEEFEIEDGDEVEDEVEVEDEEEIEVEDEVEVTIDESEDQEEEYVGDDEKYEYEKGIEAEKNALQEDLSRVMETVSTLRSELKDINLLNAKLLYTNKIFKTNNMTEAQKVKVLGAFDKTSTISEVKVVYNTISENVTFNKKSMNESVRGSASKITITPKKVKKPIMEETEMVNRFKKLAGII
jgi:hypothetical protein